MDFNAIFKVTLIIGQGVNFDEGLDSVEGLISDLAKIKAEWF